MNLHLVAESRLWAAFILVGGGFLAIPLDTSSAVILIATVTGSLTTIIAAIFAGWIAIRQLPKVAQQTKDVAAKVDEVHVLTNNNYTEQGKKIDRLELIIKGLQEAALVKSDVALAKAEVRAGDHPLEAAP